jgi:hypothetical protein
MHSTSSSTTHFWVHSNGYHLNILTRNLLFPKLVLRYKDLATWFRIFQPLADLDLVHRGEPNPLRRKREA